MAIEPRKMRKFLNDPAQVVKESLAGLAAAHLDLVRYDAAAQIIVRKDAPRKGKVALISGGGSGHEPLHGGFVGLGMLDAACPGEVFTSPVPAQMLAPTKAGGRLGSLSLPSCRQLRARRSSSCPRGRSSLVSASTASPDGGARTSALRARSST